MMPVFSDAPGETLSGHSHCVTRCRGLARVQCPGNALRLSLARRLQEPVGECSVVLDEWGEHQS